MPVDADIRSSNRKLPEEPTVAVRVAVDSLCITVGGCADRSLSITGRHLRSEHLLDGRARCELAIEQCLVPSKEVVNCRVQRPRRVGNGHVRVIGLRPGLLVSRRVLDRDRLPGGGTTADIEADGIFNMELALLLQEKD